MPRETKRERTPSVLRTSDIEKRVFYQLSREKYAAFLSEREIIDIERHFSYIANQVFQEGNPDVLQRIYGERDMIAALLAQAEKKKLRTPAQVLQTLQTLCDFIQSPAHEQTTYGRVIASIAYCEISLQYPQVRDGVPQNLFQAIERASRQQPQYQDLDLILFGAYRARLFFLRRKLGVEASDDSSGLEEPFQGMTIGTKEEAEIDLAVETVGQIYSYFIEQDKFDVRLPLVSLYHVKVDDHSAKKPRLVGANHPDRTIILSGGRLSSIQRLISSVTLGVPTHSRSHLEYRIPQILIGVITSGEGTYYETEEQEDLQSGRHFSYLYLPGLRKPNERSAQKLGGENIFELDHLHDEQVLQHATFDSLSHWIAIRISRLLNNNQSFEIIEEQNYGSLANYPLEQVRAFMETRKLALFNRYMEKWLKRITKLHPTPLGQEQSILSVALMRSQHVHGTENWGEKEALEHLTYTVRALVLKNQFTATARQGDLKADVHLIARNEQEIDELCLRHAIQEDIHDEQKFQLALRLLSQTIHPLWRTLQLSDDEKAEIIAHLADRKKEVTGELKKKLIDAVSPYIVLKHETVRHKRGPKVYDIAENDNSDSEDNI